MKKMCLVLCVSDITVNSVTFRSDNCEHEVNVIYKAFLTHCADGHAHLFVLISITLVAHQYTIFLESI